jgi:hypothetical protein
MSSLPHSYPSLPLASFLLMLSHMRHPPARRGGTYTNVPGMFPAAPTPVSARQEAVLHRKFWRHCQQQSVGREGSALWSGKFIPRFRKRQKSRAKSQALNKNAFAVRMCHACILCMIHDFCCAGRCRPACPSTLAHDSCCRTKMDVSASGKTLVC